MNSSTKHHIAMAMRLPIPGPVLSRMSRFLANLVPVLLISVPILHAGSVLAQVESRRVLFERKMKAAAQYQAVYDYFADMPELAESVQDILYPIQPEVLPTYLPPPNPIQAIQRCQSLNRRANN